jgi:hypothetical protein
MKYRADQLSNGNYAVFSGKSYEQAEKAFKQAEEEGLLGEYDNSLGDWLC